MGQLHYHHYSLIEVAEQEGVALLGKVLAVDCDRATVQLQVLERWYRKMPGAHVVHSSDSPQAAAVGGTYTFGLHTGVEWDDPGKSPIDYCLAKAITVHDLEPGQQIIIVGHATVEPLPATPENLRIVEIAFDDEARRRYELESSPEQLTRDLRDPHLADLALARLHATETFDGRLLMEHIPIEDFRSVLSIAFEGGSAPTERRAQLAEQLADWYATTETKPTDDRLALVCDPLRSAMLAFQEEKREAAWQATGQLMARLDSRRDEERRAIHSAVFYLNKICADERVNLPFDPFADVEICYQRIRDSNTYSDLRELCARVGCYTPAGRIAILEALGGDIQTSRRMKKDGARRFDPDLFDVVARCLAAYPDEGMVPLFERMCEMLRPSPAPPSGIHFITGEEDVAPETRMADAALALVRVARHRAAGIRRAMQSVLQHEHVDDAVRTALRDESLLPS